MNKYRSHLCSELSINNLGENVILSGWADTVRDHGNLIFIDLRDNYGITQCVIDGKHPLFNEISKLSNEIYRLTDTLLWVGKLTDFLN